MIHLAFKHDIAFSGGFQAAADTDRSAIETFGEALAGSDRQFLIASGTLGLAPGHVVTERDGIPNIWRQKGQCSDAMHTFGAKNVESDKNVESSRKVRRGSASRLAIQLRRLGNGARATSA